MVGKNTNAAEIPDNDPTGVFSYIDIEQDGEIKALELNLDINHTYISDLVITLKKGGVTKVIHDRDGGSDDNIKRSFGIEDFNGADSKGRWYLEIKDTINRDVGTRNQWALKITY